MSATMPVMSAQPEPPNFLIEWEPRWKAFAGALSPAMQRSPRHLQGECRAGIFPASGMVAAWVLEVALLIVIITLPGTLHYMQTFTPPPHPKYDVIYFSGDYLPQTTDAGGAQAGHTGRAGGRTAMNKQQVIKVARGDSLTEQVVDVPKIKLPPSQDAVANLIAIAAAKPGPPPTQGLDTLSKPKLLLPADAVPPEPKVARDKLQNLPDLSAQAVAPPVDVSRDKLRAMPTMAATVVPPSPQIQRDQLLRTPALGVSVVRPAPVVHGRIERVKAPLIASDVVPPPVSAREVQDNSNPKLALPPPTVVQPAPETNNGIVKELWTAAGSFFGGGTKNVVPPPVQPTAGLSDGKPLAAGLVRGLTGGPGVVPPPPAVAGSGLAGSSRGGGKGDSLADLRPSAVGPAGSGGNAAGSGVVMSMDPGARMGMPGNAAGGALAMSRTGGGRPGLGGEGNGAGFGKGTGGGSGKVGEGSGASSTGTGFGARLNAKGGISPAPGRGGAGSGGGHTEMAGVSIKGGVVNLPSFAVGGDPPSVPGHTPSQRGLSRPDITVIATPSSGGALNLYGALKGDKVYTIYIDTHQGVAVLQFADPGSRNTGFDEDLTAPEAIRTELPPGLKKSRLVVTCTMDRAGVLRNVKILQGPSSEKINLVMSALSKWRFRPVLRGNDPISVDAILGFNVDTR